MEKYIHLIKTFRLVMAIFLLFTTSALYPQEEDAVTENPLEGLDKYIDYDKPEFRALWITRFEWPHKDPEKCKQKIIQIFEDMEQANFNTAIFQVRGAAEVLYPSQLEPWSYIFDGKDPGFDPLALAIEEAHKRGIELHAYVNPIPLFSSRNQSPPKDTIPEHLFYSHGPQSEEPWVCMDKERKIMNAKGAGYWYLSPGIPGVHAYLRKALTDLVKRYDIDGIHLDRIRYPGAQYSHDPISKKRFQGIGNPNRKEWFDWQREQLDKLINDLYAEVMAINPKVVVSCAAWGIYNRYHIKGYYNFSSGYHGYYQDTWNWIDIGAMDLLMPMIYWNIPEPKPNYNELVDDFIKGVGEERFLGGQRAYGKTWDFEENINEILYSRKKGIQGTVLFAYGSTKGKGGFEKLKESLYKTKAPTPELEWKTNPEFGIILGTIMDEQGNPVEDAWVRLIPKTRDRQTMRQRVFRHVWTTSADGRFAFLKVPSVPVTPAIWHQGALQKKLEEITVSPGEVKKIEVTLEKAKQAREEAFFHIIRPEPDTETTNDVVHILGRTYADVKIRIQSEEVEVYSTGAFAKDNIPLELGENRIEITALSPEQKETTRYLSITRKEPEPPKEIKTLKILAPESEHSFLPGEMLEIKVKAPRGGKVSASLWGGKLTVPLTESADENSTGIYTAVYKIPAEYIAEKSAIEVTFEKVKEEIELTADTGETMIEVWNPTKIRVAETISDKAAISFGTHYVRLGGPYLTEVPEGTRFEIIGKTGSRYKIRLSRSLSGWVSSRNIKMLPEGTPPPRAFFTYCIINGDEEFDTLWIPLKENVVFAITPETEPENRLFIDFFNTHFATTWFSHKSGAKVIGTVTGEQIEDDRYRLTVPIKSKQIWGYHTEKDAGGLTIKIRRPPKIAKAPDSPLKGLTIALEAGHGRRDSGAVGLMGAKEKTINYNAVKAIRKVMEEKGAKVVEVRPGDSSPSLAERVENAVEADADFYLSIHANAAGTSRGFLRVSGTSTYYRDKHCQLVAKLVYDELLKLDWGEFGVVGNFHYFPLRDTRLPSMLVEQAFMSHPGDEARLLDPEYQKIQAETIVRGMEQFFDAVRE